MKIHPVAVAGRLRRLATAAILLILPAAPPALATCGSANCFLVTGTQEGVGSKGMVILDLSYRYVEQGRRLDGTRSVHEVLTPKVDFENGVLEPDHHNEVRTQNTLVQLDASYGVTDRLTLAVSLPIINQRDHEHFDEPLTTNEFTREDGTSGFGDVRLSGRYAFLVRTKDLLVGGLGVKLATGAYRLHDSEGAINEPSIQPGTGAIDVIGSIHYVHQWVPFRFEYFLSASHRATGENDLDYRMGAESLASGGFTHRVGEKFTWSVQLNARKTARDEFMGVKVPSTGAFFLNLTPGVRLGLSPSSSLYAFAQIPVHQDVNEAQLAPRTGVLLGVSKSF